MSPRTMRMLFVNVAVMLVLLAVIHGDRDVQPPRLKRVRPTTPAPEECPSFPRSLNEDAVSRFLKKAENKVSLSGLIQKQFVSSLNYLYTSQQFGSQYMQRPGMTKLLTEASDKKWEAALDILKKTLQRGATTDDIFKPSFAVSGQGMLTVSEGYDETKIVGNDYYNTLCTLVTDSKDLLDNMNIIHHEAITDECCGDAEIAHYFDDKLEDEAKRIREMAGHALTLEKMKKLGVAVGAFDSNI